jgi:SPP1 gp7 family putative phage head morphogenesis protein
MAVPSFPIYDALLKLYRTVGPAWVKQSRKEYAKASGRLGFSEQIIQLMNQYFGINLLNDAELMTKYSRQVIADVLSRSLAEGLSYDDIVNELLRHPEFNAMRARRIARTETVTAANGASSIYAQQSGNVMEKIWIAVKDKRTRDTHKSIDGRIVPMEDPFVLGKYGDLKMMHPGVRVQPNGLRVPASEVVNCRCTVAFRAKRDANGKIIRTNEIPKISIPKPAPVISKPVIAEALPSQSSISNAKSIKEAEQWAIDNGISKSVKFAGLKVKDANDINNIMKRVIDDFKLEPLRQLKGGSKSIGLGNGVEILFNKSKTATEEARKGIFDRNIKNYQQITRDRLKQIEGYPDSYEKTKAIKELNNALKYERYFAYKSEANLLQDLFIHELGHTIEDQLLGFINRSLILPRFGKINPATRVMELTNDAKMMRESYMNIYKNLTDAEKFSISKYANMDFHETFAESLVMYYREPENMPSSLYNFFIKLIEYANK